MIYRHLGQTLQDQYHRTGGSTPDLYVRTQNVCSQYAEGCQDFVSRLQTSSVSVPHLGFVVLGDICAPVCVEVGRQPIIRMFWRCFVCSTAAKGPHSLL